MRGVGVLGMGVENRPTATARPQVLRAVSRAIGRLVLSWGHRVFIVDIADFARSGAPWQALPVAGL